MIALSSSNGDGALPPHCLVVDDEPHLRGVLVRVLRSDGYSCDEASNGQEALAQLEKRPAALVLIDLHLPVLDGLGLLRQLRETHPDAAAILLAGVADVRTALDSLGKGAVDYLTKPFHIEEVRARVRQALEKRRILLENGELRQRVETEVVQQSERLEQVYLASFLSLADALEAKDTYTEGHSLRVSRLSSLIARELTLGEELLRQIELGARLHDVGKIGVRETVLNKAGPLSADEYQHVMTHAAVGWQILSPVLGEHQHALNVVRHHHERFDGRGLPDGLAGHAIPLEARIVAVADTFDAMTCERPYRPGASLDATLAELRRCSGNQFDPAVVEALVAIVQRNGGQVDEALAELSAAAGSPARGSY